MRLLDISESSGFRDAIELVGELISRVKVVILAWAWLLLACELLLVLECKGLLSFVTADAVHFVSNAVPRCDKFLGRAALR